MLWQEQGSGAVVKMTQLRLRSSSLHERGCGAVSFHDWSSWSGALLFMDPDPAPALVRFHTFIFSVVLLCLKLNRKWIIWSKLRKTKWLYQTLSNSMWNFCEQRCYHEESAKKQQSQVETIQRTVTSRNVTQNNSNINNFWKDSCWFCRQCLRIFCYFLRTESRKWMFGKSQLCPSI